MASVYPKGDKWYAHYKDERGRWRDRALAARTKTEAKRLASDLERQCERQRLGLDPMPLPDGGGTLEALLKWWLKTYSEKSGSHQQNSSAVRLHLLSSPLAELRLVEVTSGRVDAFLHAKSDVLGPQSVNHLRRFLMSAFTCAIRTERYPGPNPVLAVPRRTIPATKPGYLRADEVPRMLAALSLTWRPLFATAIYAGLRKGELLGLLKSDVDLPAGLLTVARSYATPYPKGKRVEVIPIATELRPFLEVAIRNSATQFVFPKEDGTMMDRQTKLQEVLRRALARAGIVLGYAHVCRKRGCEYVERAPDAALRRCPKHGHKLWPKGVVRPITFHHLRHTTASLLMMARTPSPCSGFSATATSA